MGANCGRSKATEPDCIDSPEAMESSRSGRSRKGSHSSTASDCDGDEPDLPEVTRTETRRSTGRQVLIQHNQSGLDSEYSVGDKAGEGTQGVVFRAMRKRTGIVRAVKKVPKRNAMSAKFQSEIAIMKRMDHPNIVKLFETFEDSHSTYLVMELCTGGELFDKIVEQGSLTEPEAALVLQDILRAVHYMHENDICHRDLKPENFLFLNKGPIDSNNLLKLIDFGIACDCGPNTYLREMCGTPYYVAPQVITRKYNKSSDLWSCGVIMYTLLCGKVPFTGPSDAQVLAKVRQGIVRFKDPAWKQVSEEALSLVKALLSRNPKDRISATDALDHEWIRSCAARAEPRLQDGLVEQIGRFRRTNRLKQAVLELVANDMKDDKIRHLREAFTALDTNQDGLLTYTEIRDGMQRGGLVVPEEVDLLIADYKDTPVDYTEFLAATLDRQAHLSAKAIRVAFGTFDLDNSGKLTIQDVARLFEGSVQSRASAARDIMDRYSTSGDGTMGLEDFQLMMGFESSPDSRAMEVVRTGSAQAVSKQGSYKLDSSSVSSDGSEDVSEESTDESTTLDTRARAE
mmetsp:Transcript_17176/g.36938  ORF Transcript_17176/g.36938 Transcript_17176/m.36938 type:complete len:571 (+) Transcript_17176:617-2329(+)